MLFGSSAGAGFLTGTYVWSVRFHRFILQPTISAVAANHMTFKESHRQVSRAQHRLRNGAARGNCLRRNGIPRSLFFVKEDSPTPKTTKTAPGKLQRLLYVVCPPASGWREQFCIDVGFPVSAAASICFHGAIGNVRIFRVADGLSIYGDHPPFRQNKLIGSSKGL